MTHWSGELVWQGKDRKAHREALCQCELGSPALFSSPPGSTYRSLYEAALACRISACPATCASLCDFQDAQDPDSQIPHPPGLYSSWRLENSSEIPGCWKPNALKNKSSDWLVGPAMG